MLKVFIHAGSLATRNAGNQLVVLDIAYAKKEAVADYLVAMSLKGVGEVAPDAVCGYPRWSASLWDLVARALTRVLYRADQAPPSPEPDKRCAWATKLCIVIERSSVGSKCVELARAEISQNGKKRGTYAAVFDEDIIGQHSASFAYGLKALNPADLALRAICWALHGTDVLGPVPALILPATMVVNGVDRFHVNALTEPALTGFARYRGINFPTTAPPEPLAKAEDYVRFLMQG